MTFLPDHAHAGRRRTQARAFGQVVRNARLRKGLSQERVAHDAGITVYTYGGIERGRSPRGGDVNPTFDTMLRILLVTTPIAFALREVMPGTDLAAVSHPGIGVAVWFHATDVQVIHEALVADGHTITAEPIDGPFGRTFTFADPDGYRITLHDRA